MTENKPRILMVDDDPAALEALEALFNDVYDVMLAPNGADAIEAVRNTDDISVVVMDIKMQDLDGVTAARAIRALAPDIPVIFHTGYPGDYDEDEIDERERPFEYVQKADPISKLTRSVRNAVEAYRSRRDIASLTRQAETAYGIVGKSPSMQEVFRLIRRVSVSDCKVMILGETGTGKELVARAIHSSSARCDNRLAIFNCNHKSADLVESELFGHVRGAFTGAVENRVGLFEYADNGTVFLDEIGDLDITTQAKLLRVLETGEYQALGTPDFRKTNVRLLCATHKDLPALVALDKFREDLYYRLKGVQIILPPLRDRREDIPLLTDRFKDRFTIECDLPPKVIDQSAMARLIQCDWPGNVRQLLDTVESLIVLTESDIIVGADVEKYLDQDIVEYEAGNGHKPLGERLKDFRRNLVIEALHETGNNVSAAARMLGVDRANLRKMIRDHKITLS